MKRQRIGSSAIALTATLAVLIAASVVADRLGAPAPVTAAALTFCTVLLCMFAGLTTRTMRLTTFRLASFRLGWTRGGSALIVILAGASLLAGHGLGPEPAAAAAGGALIAALLYGPAMQRTGAPGLGGFAGARYDSRTLSASTGLVAAVIGLALAAHASASAIPAFAVAAGASERAGAIAFAAIAVTALMPGGLASAVAAAVIATMLALAAWLLAAGMLMMRDPALAVSAGEAVRNTFAAVTLSEQVAAMAALVAGLIAWSGAGAAMRKPDLARRVPAGALLVLAALTWGATLTTAAGSAAAALPNALQTLAALAPAVLLTIFAVFAVRLAVAGLFDDVIYRLSGYSGTASGRLALHRLMGGALLVLLASRPLPQLPDGVLYTIGLLATGWPALLILPARFGRVDWRAPTLGLTVLAGGAAGIAGGAWITDGLADGALVIAAAAVVTGIAGALFWRSGNDGREVADARAAAIVRGDIPGPTVLETDA